MKKTELNEMTNINKKLFPFKQRDRKKIIGQFEREENNRADSIENDLYINEYLEKWRFIEIR